MASTTFTHHAGLLCYCRQGFESELAAELSSAAATQDIPAYVRATRNTGYALLIASQEPPPTHVDLEQDLIFARQSLQLLGELRDLPVQDRITPLIEVLQGQAMFGDVWVEHADTDEGKPLSALCRSFSNALRPALRKQGLLTVKPQPELPRLHVFFISGKHVLLAHSYEHSTPWPLGIPRLKLSSNAPSRSALKLEEALLVLISPKERERWLQPGMKAVDLGAAPGGWSWVLAHHHIQVTAIDNGPLQQNVLDTGLVTHIQADGFLWQPPKAVQWLVCDMVEQPRRVAARVATWLREGWCQQVIFNLKLPMKKRWEETQLCLDLLIEESERPLQIRARQLYHDREEITLFVRVSQ